MNKEVLDFLEELRRNNQREWFQANKPRFDSLRKTFLEEIQQLIHRIALFDPEVANVEAKDCLFRIYRDIRFSPDKTPYKTHFSVYIAAGGKSSPRAGYYMHLEPGQCLLAGGIWCPQPPLLKMLRKDIYDNMDDFLSILNEPKLHKLFPKLDGETLKRMPAGYPADYPHGEIIRHKDFCLMAQLPDQLFTASDWMEQTVEKFKLLHPLNRFLNYSVDEYQGNV